MLQRNYSAVAIGLAILVVLPVAVQGADIDECRQMLLTGEYEQCVATTADAIATGVFGESWHVIKAEAELALGRYSDALQTTQTALERYNWSLRLRLLAIEASRYAQQPELPETYTAEIATLVRASPWRYTDAENLVALGRFLLEQGADAKEVQNAFFQRARRNNPLHRVPVLALGELALEKRDFQLAAEIYGPALQVHEADPDLSFGMSLAFAGSDREIAQEYLNKTLAINPRHAPALLFQMDRLIDAEQYTAAEVLITRLLEVNPQHPQGLAYRATIQLLQADEEAAVATRQLALSTWEKNPLVDHTIGRKLSQKYRFQLGEFYQRRALEFDPDYIAAKKQLVQDLMRLGREAVGWELAEEVYQRDPYDVGIYNLLALRDELEKFETLEAPGLAVRMSAREARVYGQRVLKLLTEARDELTARYEQPLPQTILVEIFPRPADFEVRTFGMPGIVGFLGVCFGDVITANSPASQDANPVNLDAVLWHEFAHVVTLNKTNNQMPRWLSEGISVYEERRRDPSWGERMNLPYRKMILEGELSPIGEMSQMFLSPKSAVHVQFAYFQSSLIVEHLIEHYGFAALLAVLDDLAVGMSINESLPRHTAPLAQLDEEFSKAVRQLAEDFTGEAEFNRPDLAALRGTDDLPAAARAWRAEHPREYLGLKAWGQALARQGKFDLARDFFQAALDLFPYEKGNDSPALLLADLARQQQQPEAEAAALRLHAALDDDAANTFQRLIDLARAREDWEEVRLYGEKLMGVKPLIAQPHAALAEVGETLDQPALAMQSLESLLALQPLDRADLLYRLARQQSKLGEVAESRRSLLEALEEAPRYREALAFLLEMQQTSKTLQPLLEQESSTP